MSRWDSATPALPAKHDRGGHYASTSVGSATAAVRSHVETGGTGPRRHHRSAQLQGRVKPAPFWYHRPTNRSEVDNVLASIDGSAIILAGGQSVVPALARRELRPDHVVDLGWLADEAGTARIADHTIAVGPLIRLCALERDESVRSCLPVLRDILPMVANRAVRNRATVIGNVMCADPASEITALALLLGARLRVRGSDGARYVPLESMLESLRRGVTSASWVDELVIDRPSAGQAFTFEETSERSGGRAVAGVVVAARADSRGFQVDMVLFGRTIPPQRRQLTTADSDRDLPELVDQVVDGLEIAGAPRFSLRSPREIHYIQTVFRSLAVRCAHTAINQLAQPKAH